MPHKPIPLLSAALVISVTTAAAAQSQQSGNLRERLNLAYGLQLFGASAQWTAIAAQHETNVMSIRALADPTTGFKAEASIRAQPSRGFAVVPYVYASTLERNRFYGFGNDNEPLEPTSYYQLEQFLFETGLSAEFDLGGAQNRLSFGPYFRRWNTNGELDPNRVAEDSDQLDDGGFVKVLRPYGVGVFRQFGMKMEAHVGTRDPKQGARVGVRFLMVGRASPAALDHLNQTASVLGEVRTFANPNLPGDPLLVLRGRAERVFGDAPFHDAAYLGGRKTLRGYKKQQFAGDLALAAGLEVRARAGEITVKGRGLTLGPVAFVDVGRVYLDGVSDDGWHVGYGTGIWMRDHATQRQVSVSLGQGDIGPRVYISLSSPIRPS